MSVAESNVEDRGRADDGIGRKLGIGLFWLLAVYMIGMSAASIIPALYWPDSAPRPDPAATTRCARELVALEHDLVAMTAATLRRGSASGLEQSLLAWDQRSLALSGGCGALEPARRDLLRLRSHLGGLLAAYRSGTLRVQQRLQRALDVLRAGRAERPKT